MPASALRRVVTGVEDDDFESDHSVVGDNDFEDDEADAAGGGGDLGGGSGGGGSLARADEDDEDDLLLPLKRFEHDDEFLTPAAGVPRGAGAARTAPDAPP